MLTMLLLALFGLMMTGILHGIAARTKADMEDDILSIKG